MIILSNRNAYLLHAGMRCEKTLPLTSPPPPPPLFSTPLSVKAPADVASVESLLLTPVHAGRGCMLPMTGFRPHHSIR